MTEVLISDLRKLAKERNQQAIVAICVEADGTVRIVTYGATKKQCSVIGKWAEGLWNTAISAIPFRTHFGWGNGGVPQPLTAEEEASLPPAALAWAKGLDA